MTFLAHCPKSLTSLSRILMRPRRWYWRNPARSVRSACCWPTEWYRNDPRQLGPSLVAIHTSADLAVSEVFGKLSQSVFSLNKITHIPYSGTSVYKCADTAGYF